MSQHGDGLNHRGESLSASRLADVAGVASPISGRVALGSIQGLVFPSDGARCCPVGPGRSRTVTRMLRQRQPFCTDDSLDQCNNDCATCLCGDQFTAERRPRPQ